MNSKYWFLIAFFALFALAGCGGSEEGQSPLASTDGVRLVSEQIDRLTFEVQTGDLTIDLVDTKGGDYIELALPGYDRYGAVGTPALPAVRKLITLPLNATVTITATPSRIETIQLDEPVAPNQAPVEKRPGAFLAAPFDLDPSAYRVDDFILGGHARIVEEAMMRNHRIAMIEITPVDYNPVGGVLTFARELSIRIDLEGADIEATQALALRHQNDSFDAVVSRITANAGDKWGLFDAPKPGADFLILYANDFHGSAVLEYLGDLKTDNGWTVHLANVANIGSTTTAIRQYILDQYDALPNLTFVLLIGDTDTIPNAIGQGSGSPATDLYYSCITEDYIPDLLIGRFPVRTVAHLYNMVAKTEAYQQDAGAWRKTGAFMASTDRYWVSEGTHNVVTNYLLDPAGFASEKLYSYTFSATTKQVTDAFNGGVNFGIYSGHGDVTEWADGPVFKASHVRNLTNENFPFVCSFSCLTGKYQVDECFAETWVRYAHGASVALASSVTSYWDQDDWYEKGMFLAMFNFPFEGYPDQVWAATASLFGKAYVWLRSNRGGGDSQRYFEMYNLFGDPSLVFHTD